MSIIQEYKADLKELRRIHRAIAIKKYEVIKCGKKHIVDDRTSKEISDQKILASAISTTEYAIHWLKYGSERERIDENVTKLSKGRREQLWSYMAEAESFYRQENMLFQCEETQENERNTQMIETILDKLLVELTDVERQTLTLNKQQITAKEIGEMLNVTEKSVSKSVDRAKKKLERALKTDVDLSGSFNEILTSFNNNCFFIQGESMESLEKLRSEQTEGNLIHFWCDISISRLVSNELVSNLVYKLSEKNQQVFNWLTSEPVYKNKLRKNEIKERLKKHRKCGDLKPSELYDALEKEFMDKLQNDQLSLKVS